MKKNWIIILVILGVLALMFMFSVGKYNSLVVMSEEVEAKISEIDNQLQRRNDLIPNLVETVKGFAAQEKEIFTNVAEARSKLLGAGNMEEKIQADAQLTGALGRLLAISEAYPELKSDANFRQLSDELAGTENRIAVARRDYNEVAKAYNQNTKRFPMVLFRNALGFEEYKYFEAQEGAEAAPEVKFGN